MQDIKEKRLKTRQDVCNCWIPQIILSLGSGWCTTCGGWGEITEDECKRRLEGNI